FEERLARRGPGQTDTSRAVKFGSAQYRERRDFEFCGGDFSFARISRKARRPCKLRWEGRRREKNRGLGTCFVVRLQNGGRSFCGANQLFQSDVGRAEKRCDADE